MRPKVIAGNWKMNKDADGSVELINGLITRSGEIPNGVTVVLCPPFTSLAIAQRLLDGVPMALGGQNMHYEDEGAFTGEISAGMLKSVGCTFVIIGHSERRQIFGETNDLVNKKVKKALSAGLRPIICVGETLEERERGVTEQVINVQLKGALQDVPENEVSRAIIAYEPVWAIGTGKNATPDQAADVHKYIRKILGQFYSWNIAEKTIIQYGGSVKPDNARGLLAKADIDGALVGGACLKPESFMEIVKASAS
ncbi:MAG: triose-phosphate isomerase [Ignavibacterium sp.]|jgi:triosephosphate isomerase